MATIQFSFIIGLFTNLNSCRPIINGLFFILMESTPTVSIHAYNGMKGRLVRALKEVDHIKGTDRSYANLAAFIQQNLKKKDDISVVSQEVPIF